jgi:hypothetical protein
VTFFFASSAFCLRLSANVCDDALPSIY